MLKSWVLILLLAVSASATDPTDDLFASALRMQIEIPDEGMATLRGYKQIWRQPRPERIDVRVTIREGGRVYTNVALHLKGSFSFAPIDAKPSLTLNFSKFADGQKFHGLTKIHLNNSIQDESYLCEKLARELFQSLGVPSPRAGHALVKINGRDAGLYVLIEGANKQFVKRHFDSTKGNLYDGGSGGDITKALETDSGENPNDRTDLTNLVKAAREPVPAQRLARLEQVLDVERFITFAAAEIFLVHWDGYAAGPNNYRLFHDTSRDKMIFIPHGLDQLFGVSRSPTFPITPPFKGLVAKGLFAVPEGRRRYLARVQSLSTNEFTVEKLHAHVDRLAAQLRPALADHRNIHGDFDDAVRSLKQRITLRTQSVAQQLGTPKRPVPLAADSSVQLGAWNFKPGPTQPALGSRTVTDNRQILSVRGRTPGSSGAWRTIVLLDAGHYEFTGRARTEGLTAADARNTNGVILRISGIRSTEGITIADDWTPLRYEFDVSGVEDVELICEFRGAQPTTGSFDVSSLRLVRKGPVTSTRQPVPNE
ncbi:MAG TPA: CotH kinase family protein [Candidatus Limnocylindria bacterium]|nr:CotH kinase family protein [Candidatus Limnocylindria bacterium]